MDQIIFITFTLRIIIYIVSLQMHKFGFLISKLLPDFCCSSYSSSSYYYYYYYYYHNLNYNFICYYYYFIVTILISML
jgi:hypothetical protein